MKALKILIPTFFVVLVINQSAFGMCFEPHCLAAAFPRVAIISVAISAFIYWVSKQKSS
jgi:hypothetical protein